jgi:hypothetical protein
LSENRLSGDVIEKPTNVDSQTQEIKELALELEGYDVYKKGF